MLMRFDPFRELDRLTSQTLGRQWSSVLPMDAYRHGDRFLVHVDLPGIDPSSVDLTVEKNVLTIKAERSWQRQDGDEVVIAERPQGTFTRQLFLGESLDTDHLEATYDNGVLTVTIPVADRAKPRKVAITNSAGSGRSDGQSHAIEATASTSSDNGEREPDLVGTAT
ncbi:MAG: Hsp20/alpha crystallin family protein [Actinobacteria bacterium]|nr:Hsp20/alpha crystallin family protein [Actinomycetota bacterium]